MKLLLILFFFCFATVLAAQQNIQDTSWKKSCLFRDFSQGVVLMKDHKQEQARLNYNTLDNSVVFLQGDQIMELTGTELVDTVFMNNKKFICIKNKFYEVADTDSAQLLINYNGKLKPLTTTTEHEGSYKKNTNETSNTVTGTYIGQNYKGDFTVEITQQFYMLRRHKLYSIDSEKKFLKAFGIDKEQLIKQFIAENKIDFKSEKDLLKLIRHFNN
ncbi:MAG: hypothetical protein JSU05_09980 [Bacteroidetes bacterium]|nr:hypothetical protein [Bacteroidota bacterium]